MFSVMDPAVGALSAERAYRVHRAHQHERFFQFAVYFGGVLLHLFKELGRLLGLMLMLTQALKQLIRIERDMLEFCDAVDPPIEQTMQG